VIVDMFAVGILTVVAFLFALALVETLKDDE